MGGNTKTRKVTRFKGAVLYTVLAVMMVMIIMMLTTIALAGTASKRAYSQYNDQQTANTARSVVDSVVTALQDDKVLGSSIIDKIRASSGAPVPVDVTTSGLTAYGDIQSLTFTCVGKDEVGDIYLTGSGKEIIKITAVVSMGNDTSTYSQYVIGDHYSASATSSGGGLLALGGYNGAGTSPITYSPTYVAVNEAMSYGRISQFKNESLAKLFVINNSAYLNANAKFMMGKNVTGDSNGLAIMGNCLMQNNITINSNFQPVDGTDQIKTIPYVYVDGGLQVKGKFGEPNHPVNIYCGHILANGDQKAEIYGDVFCYNTGADVYEANPLNSYTIGGNPINYIPDNFEPTASDENSAKAFAEKSWSYIGGAAESNLTKWASSLTDKMIETGNVYTKGSLSLQNKFHIDGEVYVGQDLKVDGIANSGDVMISGNVFVDGAVTGGALAMLPPTVNIYKKSSTGYAKVQGPGPDTASLSAKCNAFISGDLTKDKVNEDIVTSPDDVKQNFYVDVNKGTGNPPEWHFKDAVNISQLDSSVGAYYRCPQYGKLEKSTDGSSWTEIQSNASVNLVDSGNNPVAQKYDYNVKITDSCTLMGNLMGLKIYIDPGDNKTIWINLYDVTFDTCTIVVNDYSGKSKVNFYLPTGQNYGGSQDTKLRPTNIDNSAYENVVNNYIKNNAYHRDRTSIYSYDGKAVNNSLCFKSSDTLMTLRYYSAYKLGDNLNMVTYPTASPNTDTTDDWMIPGIKIFSNETDPVFIEICNSQFSMTGDIVCPNGYFKQDGGGGRNFSGELKYNGATVTTGNKPACIGSIIVDHVVKLQNDYSIFYVDDPLAGMAGGSALDVYQWIPVEGYADF